MEQKIKRIRISSKVVISLFSLLTDMKRRYLIRKGRADSSKKILQKKKSANRPPVIKYPNVCVCVCEGGGGSAYYNKSLTVTVNFMCFFYFYKNEKGGGIFMILGKFWKKKWLMQTKTGMGSLIPLFSIKTMNCTTKRSLKKKNFHSNLNKI